jgi:hypothetical protein
VAFIHTTWDRFQDASEINDLFIDGGPYVDRLYAILKERGIHAERNYRVRDASGLYEAALVVPYRGGRIEVRQAQMPLTDNEAINLADEIEEQLAA